MSIRSLNSYYIVGLVIGVWFGGFVGCEPKAASPRRQAILLLLDAARPDRFSCYGYKRATTPEMDRLAGQGVVFRRHFAQGTSTRVSVSSLMYSRFFCLPLLPNSAQVPYSDPTDLFRRPDDEQISFPKVLESAGFKTAAISAHLWTGQETAFAAEFGEMHDLGARSGMKGQAYPSAETVIDYTIEWIRENKDRNYFLYVHLMDTHYPHEFGVEAQEFFGAAAYDAKNFRPGGGRTVPDSALTEEDRRYANALYDGDLRYTDRHIGRLTKFLQKKGLLDNTLIAITADHGEHLFDLPGGKPRQGALAFSHGGPWLDAVARIPLVIHYPSKLHKGEFGHFSEGVDVGPTLLGLLNINIPPGKEFDGIDLVQVIKGDVPPKDHVLARRSIRTAKYKCLFEDSADALLADPPPAPGTLSGQLYDLAADPYEVTDVFQSEPEVIGELFDRYRTSLLGPFRRYEAARTSEQPTSQFAISARFMNTDDSLPKATSRRIPDGWSRLKRGSDTLLVASNTHDSLSVQFPLPNGSYGLVAQLQGQATIEVGGQKRELNGDGLVELGVISLTDEVFRATILPQGPQPLYLSFFGFVPPRTTAQDRQATEEQLERLRALGYVD